MTEPIRKDESAGGRDRAAPNAGPTVIYGERRRRSMGWRTKDVLRTAALVIAMYVGVRMIWFASPLFLTAFLGLLFGLAVSSGVDHLAHWRIARGLGAALIVITFLGLLVGFGASVAPTIRAQSVELRRRLPEAIDRLESWANRHNDGLIGSFLTTSNGPAKRDTVQSTGAASSSPPRAAAPPNEADTASATPLRDRISRQMAGATRYLFPFLSSTLAVLGGLLIILFLAIYIGADPDL
ncbi:MAG TPA: AI-2E family transporter, partial [Gemmatimonadaceae bacterium]|nr:AI-2E family transporter [Gemmatimonadaceae bacterium]